VGLVKELMGANRQLRGGIDSLNEQCEKAENETFHLSTENRELRDRIEILENVVGQSATVGDTLDDLDWRDFLGDDMKAPKTKSNN